MKIFVTPQSKLFLAFCIIIGMLASCYRENIEKIKYNIGYSDGYQARINYEYGH